MNVNDTYFHRVQKQSPTGLWINNVTPREARQAIAAGATGCTQNPAYTWRMLQHKGSRDRVEKLLNRFIKECDDDNAVQAALQRELVGEIARIFSDVYKASGGKHGYVSIQGDPFHEESESIVNYAHDSRAAGENIMVKVPVTQEGLHAIEILASERIPINATEVMTVQQALDVCTVYNKATYGMKNPAPLFFSHIVGIFDEYVASVVKNQGIDIPKDYVWQAGVAVAKKIDQLVRENGAAVGFISGGARGLHHFTEMVGCNAVVTINWEGAAKTLIKQDPPVVQRFLQPAPFAVIDELCQKIPDFRKAYEIGGIHPEEYEEYGPVTLFRSIFESAWSNMLGVIAKRREQMGRQ